MNTNKAEVAKLSALLCLAVLTLAAVFASITFMCNSADFYNKRINLTSEHGLTPILGWGNTSGMINTKPNVQDIVNQTAYVGTEFTLQVNASSPLGRTLTYACNASLFSIKSTTGLIGFTPTNTDKGVYNITINVSDGTDVVSVDFVLTIPNRPPAVQPIGNKTVFVGEELSLQINATDADNDTLSYTTDSSLFTIDSATGSIRFTPTKNDKGEHTIIVSVNDGIDTMSVAFNLTIPNRPPVIAPIGNQTAFAGTEFILQANAVDADNDTLTYTDSSPLFAVNSTTGQIRFMPSNVDKGAYAITINASDGTDIVNTSFVLTIPNRPPVIASISNQGVFAGSEFILQVDGTDPDGDNLTYGMNSTLTGINSTTGLIAFTPDNSDRGEYAVWVNVTDGMETSSTSFNLSIPNRPPVIAPIANWTIVEGQLFAYQVNATDADNDTLNYALLAVQTTAAAGSEQLNINLTTGFIRFIPGRGDVGSHIMIVVSASDGNATTNGSFYIIVQARPILPIASIVSITPNPVEENQTIALNGTGNDTDGTIIEYNWIVYNVGFNMSYSKTEPVLFISSLPIGNYTAWLRVKDNNGMWSLAASAQFRVAAAAPSNVAISSDTNSKSSIFVVGSLSEMLGTLSVAERVSIAAVTMLSLFGAAFYVYEPFRFYTYKISFALAPLYTRINKTAETPQRDKILKFIEEHPGENFSAIKKALGVSTGFLVYYINSLEVAKKIAKRHEGRLARLYPIYMIPTVDFTLVEDGQETVMKRIILTDRQRSIIEEIKKTPGITLKELSAKLDLSIQLVSYHIGGLQKGGLIRTERNWKSVRCFTEKCEYGA